MCGILGQVNFNGKPVDGLKLIQARDVLTHRGPDDAGIYISKGTDVGLAHRRLSIIDLSSGGHQPMSTQDGRYTIVFNGEIYNYKEIQNSKLKNKKFRSCSDTEILLELYVQEGPECLKDLRGMFAFAVWDEKEKKLFAARDRFGIKPLFYLDDSNSFIFSSEIKGIKSLRKNLTVSMEAVDTFLKTGSVPAPLTIYKEINALKPGHYIEIGYRGGINLQRYWHFFDMITNEGNGTERKYDNEAKERIRFALRDTVRARNVSDIEVGAFLSGGIDSTAIVSLMRSIGKEEITTVSVTFPGNKLDESKYSKLAADTFKTKHIEVPFTENDMLDDLDKIFDTMDQPTIDGINTYFVSKAAKSAGLKAIMSGIGGDELFGGYPSFIKIPSFKRIKSVPLAKTAMNVSASLFSTKLPVKVVEYFRNPEAPNAEYKLLRGLFTQNELTLLGWNHSYSHPFDEQNGFKASTIELQCISYLESTKYMANQLLMDSDLFSMTHSLELRVPFVDEKLYSMVLPYVDRSDIKRNFKRLLVDNVESLPVDISSRKKMGFTFPFENWIRTGQLKERTNEALAGNKLNNIIEAKGINILLKKFSEGKLHWSRIWALTVLSKII